MKIVILDGTCYDEKKRRRDAYGFQQTEKI